MARRGAMGVAWKVYRLRPSLALIPAGGLAALLATVAVLMLCAQGLWRNIVDGRSPTVGQEALLVVCYPLLTSVAVFFSAALYRGVDGVLRRERPPLRAVFLATWRRLHRYALWGVLAQVVAVVESMLAVSLVLELLMLAFDVTWWAAAYFILPVMVAEDLGFVAAVRRSTRLGRSALGERASGVLRLQLAAVALVVVPALVALVYGAESGSTALLLLGVGLAAAWAVLVAVLITTVSGAFRMVLYHRALRDEPQPAVG